MDASKVKIIIIGAGKMGWEHTRAFMKVPAAEVVGVVSRSGTSAEKLADHFGIKHFGKDWKEIADKTGANACLVAVSHLQNPITTREVLEYGLHVLSEKPVAFDSQTIIELAELAESKGLINMAAVNRRFFPSVQQAYGASRLSGKILGMTCFGFDPVSPYLVSGKHDPFVYENWVLFQTIHLIDIVRFLGGDVKGVTGHQQTVSGELNIVANIQFEEMNCAYQGYSSTGRQWGIYVHCDGFEIILNPLEQAVLKAFNGVKKNLNAKPKGKKDQVKEGLLEQATCFVNCIRDASPVPIPGSDFRDHAKSVLLIEDLLKLKEI